MSDSFALELATESSSNAALSPAISATPLYTSESGLSSLDTPSGGPSLSELTEERDIPTSEGEILPVEGKVPTSKEDTPTIEGKAPTTDEETPSASATEPEEDISNKKSNVEERSVAHMIADGMSS